MTTYTIRGVAHLRWDDDSGQHAITLGDTDVIVGRSPDCEVVIAKGFVSRRHCRVFRSGDGWAIADLGSTGGTFVNRVRVGNATPLAPGDRVMARSEHLMTFDSGPAPRDDRKPLGNLGVVPGTSDFEKTGDVEKPDAEAILSTHSIETSDFMSALNEAKSIDLRSLAGKSSGGSHLAALVRVSETLRKCADVPAVCRAALELAMEATGAARGVIGLRAADGTTFERVAERGGVAGGEGLHISRTFVDKMVRERMALIATDATHDLALAASRSIVAAKIRSILAAPLWDGDEIPGYLYLDTTDGAALVRLFTKDDLNLVIAICHQSGAEIGRHRLGARIRDEEARRRNLARMVSADVIKHIEEEAAKSGGADLSFTAKEQEVTILFADLQGFTAMAERMKPNDIKLLLDDYFDRMTDILVDQHHGTLDKYMGDAIMALFGAPFSDPDGIGKDAMNAVNAALVMRDAVETLRKKRSRVYGNVHVRCGINSGRVVAGMLGSQRRLEYSVVGDVVNVASRLESTGEPGRIQIGEATYELVKTGFSCEFAGERKLKNRTEPIRCWWVNGRA